MKNTFAVTMTLLLALTLGGSYAAYQIAVAPHHTESKAEGGTGDQEERAGSVPSEEAPSATSTATGAAGSAEAQGNAKAPNAGGEQAGPNGAVMGSQGAAIGNQENGVTENNSATVATTEGAQAGENTTANEGSESGRPPAEMSSTGATVTTEAGNVEEGQAKFVSSCGACHGAEGGGGIGAALNTADGPKSWTLDQFKLTLREGKTPDRELAATMPRFSPEQLSDAEIANIHAYIKTLN
ncbi:c-type cytochrome [Deinococcus puniceus]|uniref:c-type cytochrome n=1 Tax=Deinococcus puniceus TaxID=1182568 RepID=UPI0007C941E1|nr:c-type cytochrome [Deinococcus puniceus]